MEPQRGSHTDTLTHTNKNIKINRNEKITFRAAIVKECFLSLKQ